jgi:hypothetical protein
VVERLHLPDNKSVSLYSNSKGFGLRITGFLYCPLADIPDLDLFSIHR